MCSKSESYEWSTLMTYKQGQTETRHFIDKAVSRSLTASFTNCLLTSTEDKYIQQHIGNTFCGEIYVNNK